MVGIAAKEDRIVHVEMNPGPRGIGKLDDGKGGRGKILPRLINRALPW